MSFDQNRVEHVLEIIASYLGWDRKFVKERQNIDFHSDTSFQIQCAKLPIKIVNCRYLSIFQHLILRVLLFVSHCDCVHKFNHLTQRFCFCVGVFIYAMNVNIRSELSM